MLLITDRNPDNLFQAAEYIRQNKRAPFGTFLEQQTFPLEVFDVHRVLANDRAHFFSQVDEFLEDPFIPEILIALSSVYPSETSAMRKLLKKARDAAGDKEKTVSTVWFCSDLKGGATPPILLPAEIKVLPNSYYEKVTDSLWQQQHAEVLEKTNESLRKHAFSNSVTHEELRSLLIDLIRCEEL